MKLRLKHVDFFVHYCLLVHRVSTCRRKCRSMCIPFIDSCWKAFWLTHNFIDSQHNTIQMFISSTHYICTSCILASLQVFKWHYHYVYITCIVCIIVTVQEETSSKHGNSIWWTKPSTWQTSGPSFVDVRSDQMEKKRMVDWQFGMPCYKHEIFRNIKYERYPCIQFKRKRGNSHYG